MAITSEKQTEILKIVVGLFNAAPGSEYMTELANFVESGGTTAQLADALAANSIFTIGVMGGKVTVESQVAVLMSNFGLVADGISGSAATLAEDYFTDRISAGDGFGAIVYDAVQYLNGSIAPVFLAVANLLANKALVAGIYSESYPSSSLSELQAILAGVTGTALWTTEEAEAYVAETAGTLEGDTYLLTDGQDVISISETNTLDTVRGTVNDDGADDLSTFGQADLITGNGHTVIKVTVLDPSGGVGYVEMSGVDALHITNAAGNNTVTFDADSYGSDISTVVLSGQDDLDVSITNLAAEGSLELRVAGATTGTLDVNGTLDGMVIDTAYIYDWDDDNGGDDVLAFGPDGIDVTIGESATVSLILTNEDTDDTAASVGDISFAHINVDLGLSGDGDITVYNYANNTGTSGTATVGDFTVGDITMVIGTDADMGIELYNSADIDTGDAVVGNVTVGNVDVEIVGEGGSVSTFYVYNSASVANGSGDATAGNITLGNFNIDMVDSADYGMYLYTYNYAYAGTTGDAVVGDTTLGNIVITGGDNLDAATFDLEQLASASTGDATVGDITVGTVSVNIGDNTAGTADFYFTFENYAYAHIGNAAVGNVTVGDVDIVVGNSNDAYLYVTQSATVATTGSASVGDTTIGNVSMEGGTSSYLWYEVNITANGTTEDSIGTTTIGNIDMYGGASADVNFSLNMTADIGDIGSVTVGDISMEVEDSGSVNVSMDITADNIGAIEIGDISFVLGSNATIDTFALSVSADDGDIASFSIGNISIIGNEGASDSSQSFVIRADSDIGNIAIGNIAIDAGVDASFNSNTWTFDAVNGSLGDITIGDIDLTAATSAFIYYEQNFDAENEIGNVSVGNVTLRALASDAGTGATVSLQQYFSNSDDIGDVEYSNINLTASGTSAYAYMLVDISNDSNHDIGDITFGNINLNAKNGGTATSGASALLDFSFTSADTIGTITIGNIDIALSQTADATNLAYAEIDINATAAVINGGDIVIGDISLTEGSVTDDFVSSASVSAYLYADGNADITVGNITVSGGYVNSTSNVLDNYGDLDNWLVLTAANGDITVGDIDYSGYEATATIDLATGSWKGAENITAAQGDTTIYDNVTKNIITLGDGDDTVVLDAAAENGTAEADIDQIISFDAGNDVLDLSGITGSTVNLGGTEASYANFLAAADAADEDVFIVKVSGNTFVAVDANNDDDIDFVVELVGVTNVGTADIIV